MADVPALRWCGASGLCGAALLLTADWFLLGTSLSGPELMENWLSVLARMPGWRLTVGGLLGPVGAWCYVVGFWQVYLALRPGGRRLAFGCFTGLSMTFIWVAGAFHTSFPFIAHARLSQEAATGEGAAVVRSLCEQSFAYFGLLLVLGLIPSVAALGILAYAVLRRAARYPRWFVVCNPAVLYALAYPFRWMPAPLGGLLAIGTGNLVFLAFFALSTILLWNGGRDVGADLERSSAGRALENRQERQG